MPASVETSEGSPPTSCTARHGRVSSTCSTPSGATRRATFRPLSSSAIVSPPSAFLPVAGPVAELGRWTRRWRLLFAGELRQDREFPSADVVVPHTVANTCQTVVSQRAVDVAGSRTTTHLCPLAISTPADLISVGGERIPLSAAIQSLRLQTPLDAVNSATRSAAQHCRTVAVEVPSRGRSLLHIGIALFPGD